MAVRRAAETAAVPVPDEPADQVAALPSFAALNTDAAAASAAPEPVAVLDGDDDDAEEIFDAPDAEDFYADAFEVLE